ELASHLQQHDFLARDGPGGAVSDEVLETPRVCLIGEVAASARGLRVVFDAVLLGHPLLLATRPAVHTAQPLAVESPLLLGPSRRQQLRGEGTQEASRETGFLLDDPQGFAVLREGPLSDDFSREDRLCTR